MCACGLWRVELCQCVWVFLYTHRNVSVCTCVCVWVFEHFGACVSLNKHVCVSGYLLYVRFEALQ